MTTKKIISKNALSFFINEQKEFFEKSGKKYIILKNNKIYQLTPGLNREKQLILFTETKSKKHFLCVKQDKKPDLNIIELALFTAVKHGKDNYNLYFLLTPLSASTNHNILLLSGGKKIIGFTKGFLALFNFRKETILKKDNKAISPDFNYLKSNPKNKHKLYDTVFLAARKNKPMFFCHLKEHLINEQHSKNEFSIFSATDVTHDASSLTEYNQKNRKIFQDVFTFAKTGIARVAAANGKIISVNDYFVKLFGLPRTKILSCNINELVGEAHPGKTVKFGKLSNRKIQKSLISLKGDSKGRVFNVSCSTYEKNNKPLFFILVFSDITEQKKNQDDLSYQNAKLNAVFQLRSHRMWVINKQLKFIDYNQQFLDDILKHKTGSNTSRTNKQKITVNPALNPIWKSRYKEVFNGKPLHVETELITREGKSVWREVFLEPIKGIDGKINEVFGLAHDITEKKHNQLVIQASLNEKEILLKEVHHRVKNNMQVISSILNLQSGLINDTSTIEILKECQGRIKTMALIHENLYLSKNFAQIQTKTYFESIIQNVSMSYEKPNQEIEIVQDVFPTTIDIDKAIPCGLILNELIVNSYKHAFKGLEKGIIKVLLFQDNGTFHLQIQDNGVGLGKKSPEQLKSSLGIQLVYTLVDQLEGGLVVKSAQGTSFLITFKK